MIVKVIECGSKAELERVLNTIGYDRVLQVLHGVKPSALGSKFLSVYTVIYKAKG